MSSAHLKQRLIKLVRLYPILALSVLLLAYLLGGFSEKDNPLISQSVVITSLYLFVGSVPLFFIIAFIVVGNASESGI
jgi:multisubunit Na+/H+ antiporter MnhC subunit